MKRMPSRLVAYSLMLFIVGCGGGSKPNGQTKGGSQTTGVPPATAPSASATSGDEPKLSEREVAEEILQLGGGVETLKAGKRKKVKAGESLPADPFVVVSCYLDTDEFSGRDLPMLKYLKRLGGLKLAFSSVTDEDLRIVEQLPDLKWLHLGDVYKGELPYLSGKGLGVLSECESLQKVVLVNAPNIGGDGLQHIARNRAIRSVSIFGMLHLSGDDLRQLLEPSGVSDFRLLHQTRTPIPVSKIEVLGGLSELYFHDCAFDEAGISALCKFRSIARATFSYCTITPSQEETLRASLQGAKLDMYKLRPER